MKAFVIKNKEGKYYSRNLLNPDNILFENSIVVCEHFATEEIAKFEITFNELKDCEVVEITIVEGDLEQDNKQLEIYKNLERYDVGELLNENIKLRQKNNELKEQLDISRKALEFACGIDGDIFKCPNVCEIGDDTRCSDCKFNYFIERAKESINEDRN